MHSHPSELGALYPPLTRAARKLAPDRAEDLVQDTLLAVLKRQSRGAEIDNLQAYCRRTLVNLAHSPASPAATAESRISLLRRRARFWNSMTSLLR